MRIAYRGEIVPFELNWMSYLFGDVRSISGDCDKVSALEVDIDDLYAGVVRFDSTREILDKFILNGSEAERSMMRFVLLDGGSGFETAKTVNDLFKAVYDALEGTFHRQF